MADKAGTGDSASGGFSPKISQSTFNDVGGAVSDLFAAKGYGLKAKGNRLEEENYNNASIFADQNAVFTEMSTRVKEAQLDRQLGQTIGGQQSDIAGAGFGNSGTALDLMRDSASQGALTRAVATEQGSITEEGYREQGQSYRNQAAAAEMAAQADDNAATGANISAGIKGVAAVASLL